MPRGRALPFSLSFGLILCLSFFSRTLGAELPPPSHRVYSYLLEPREHPDYERRAVKPPTWDTFKNRTQFTTLRGFNVEKDRIVGYAEELEKFTRTYELGDVIWPSYPILFATNIAEFADEIKRRDLYLFDVWGYVPGSGPGGYWQQFKPPRTTFEILESRLGSRWLGTDIGEQDGRYIGGYANQMTPASASKLEQYLNFQRHFEKMGDDLGHKHAALVSLNFGHYLIKEGTYTLIGAETAQALPNNQVYYAFIRGAGKEYGVPWFGNASIFNRWGFKTYGSSGRSDGYEHGPTKGTSLSLMKRLLYSHILYNSVAVGFENGWFEGDKLSPIGRIQQSANRWVKTHGQPGIMHTPVALLLDFYSGWSFPRHLYSDNVYRSWGNLTYWDSCTDAVLDMLYPGYQDSSYFHDESGFITPTPYGDIADCLLSDAPLWVLERYPVVVLAGDVAGGQELFDKLQAYVAGGGHLVLTEANLKKFPPRLGPVHPKAFFDEGKGKVFTVTNDVDVSVNVFPELKGGVDNKLPRLCTMDPELHRVLDEEFRRQQLFSAGNQELSLITCRREPGNYTIGIANNSWREQSFAIVSHCGAIQKVEELPLDNSEKGAVGYAPESVATNLIGRSTATTIAGGDVRIFRVFVTETGVEEIAHRLPPARPHDCAVPLRETLSVKREILSRPTFFEHFDSVVVDWSYLHQRETRALEEESRWLRRQQVKVIVDLSSGVNLYPGLRLVDNAPEEYAASMRVIEDVLSKMPALNANSLLLSLHRHPENNFTGEQTEAAFVKTLQRLGAEAAKRDVTLYLRMTFGKPPWNLEEAGRLLGEVNTANVRLAPATALLPEREPSAAEERLLKEYAGLWLVAAARKDATGHLFDAHAPLRAAKAKDRLARWRATAPSVPLLLDALYQNSDMEYQDAVALLDLDGTGN